MPYADAISVTECATVNDVITIDQRAQLAERNDQAQQEQQVIGAVEDVEEALAREQVERLVPARIEMHDAGVGVDVEGALGLAGLQEPQHDVDLQAEARQARADREVRLIRGDRILEHTSSIPCSQ